MSDGARVSSRDDVRRAPLVLVVEDEKPMRRLLRISLGAHGFRLLETATARDGLLAVITLAPDLVLLDLGLPDGDGVELTRQVRRVSSVPILVVSARGRESDRKAALDAGADDYVSKPFEVHDLLTRMRVALRPRVPATGELPPEFVIIGELRIELVGGQVAVARAKIHLTPSESRLLGLLVRNIGRLLTHAQIVDEVWGPADAGHLPHVAALVAALRKKIEADAARPRFLITEPGLGYRLRDGAADRS